MPIMHKARFNDDSVYIMTHPKDAAETLQVTILEENEETVKTYQVP